MSQKPSFFSNLEATLTTEHECLASLVGLLSRKLDALRGASPAASEAAGAGVPASTHSQLAAINELAEAIGNERVKLANLISWIVEEL